MLAQYKKEWKKNFEIKLKINLFSEQRFHWVKKGFHKIHWKIKFYDFV